MRIWYIRITMLVYNPCEIFCTKFFYCYLFDKEPCIKKEVKGNEMRINTCKSLTFYFFIFLLNFFFRTQQTLEYEGRELRRGYSAYP